MSPEAEFLELRARQAKLRMQRTVNEMVDGVLTPLEVKPLVRRHPWASMGIAIVGGFFTGLALRPRRDVAATPRKPQGLVGRLARTLRRGVSVMRGSIGAMVLANLRDAVRTAPHRRNGAHTHH